MKRCAVFLFLLSTAVVASVCFAEPEPRTISVAGDADVRVAPDRVVVTVGVETRDPELAKAKKDNDDRVRRLIAALKGQKIDAKDIQTDYISVEPHYRDYETKDLLLYAVRKTTVVTVRDLSRFEAVLDAVLSAGANQIAGISFETSDLRKHRDRAREMALKAAREKASDMAGVLGMKIGAARSIQEGGGRYIPYVAMGSMASRGMAQNVSQSADSGSSDGETVAPGQIVISSSVNVVFDLVK